MLSQFSESSLSILRVIRLVANYDQARLVYFAVRIYGVLLVSFHMAKKSDPAAVDPSRSVRDVFYPKGRKRGLIVRIQVDYSRAGNLLRYSLSLIDLSSSIDNGRIVGYDNAHGKHHRHYFGRVDCVEFESYEKLESQFEAQVRQYLETGTC
jgi:hypothetical protein